MLGGWDIARLDSLGRPVKAMQHRLERRIVQPCAYIAVCAARHIGYHRSLRDGLNILAFKHHSVLFSDTKVTGKLSNFNVFRGSTIKTPKVPTMVCIGTQL